MGSKVHRTCHRCGARLAADNAADVCAPCNRRQNDQVSLPAIHDDEFWQRPAMTDAFRSRHFGRVMYAYRYEHRPVLTQAAMARWLGMTQAQVSRLERSPKAPSDLDKLETWATILHIPESHLWFALPDEPPKDEANPPRGTELNWFESPSRRPPATSSSRPQVTVDSVRSTTATFRQLDNRFGGGHARGMVTAYLANEIVPSMRDHRTGRNHEQFVIAVAELNQLAGWMAYDMGDSISGRRHLQQALRMSQSANDPALSAEMLAGMSHQAAHQRNGPTSVSLARAARETASETGLAALDSETAVMEAHGLALLKDRRGCITALREAETAFGKAGAQDRPGWLSYYDGAYLAAKMAHCLRELGDLRNAERFARRSLEMSAGYDRGKLFNTALLASILADRGQLEEACAVGRDAVRLAGHLQSARMLAYLQDFASRLRRHQAPMTADLDQELRSLGIN